MDRVWKEKNRVYGWKVRQGYRCEGIWGGDGCDGGWVGDIDDSMGRGEGWKALEGV